MSVIFDGVALSMPEPFEPDIRVTISETILLSGKTSIQSSPETGFRVRFRCHTRDYSDVTALQAKIGTGATLTIDGTDHTKCFINSFKFTEYPRGKWEYEVGFTQETA